MFVLKTLHIETESTLLGRTCAQQALVTASGIECYTQEHSLYRVLLQAH